MDLFSCNNCKRCRRRTPSTGDDENDVDRRRRHNANLHRERIINDCCAAAAAMYFYATQRRASSDRQRQAEVDIVPFENLELTVSTAGSGGARASILKKSDDSPISVTSAVGARRSPCVAEKRASFNEAVDVIVADHNGRQVVADSVRLKRSPQLDTSATSDHTAGQCRAKQAFAKMVFPPASRCRHAFQLASTDVERRPDGSRYLRAVIRPAVDHNDNDRGVNGEQQTPARDERVVVRAAGRGSRLVVGAYRPEPLGDGTNYLRQVRAVYLQYNKYE